MASYLQNRKDIKKNIKSEEASRPKNKIQQNPLSAWRPLLLLFLLLQRPQHVQLGASEKGGVWEREQTIYKVIPVLPYH